MIAVIGSFEELIDTLEERKEEKRQKIGKTRTKLESHEAKGEMLGIDEAIYLVKALQKGLTPEGKAMIERIDKAEKERQSKKDLKPLPIQ